MRGAAYVLVAINVLAWGGLIWSGVGLLHGVADKHVPGYPNTGQVVHYLVLPSVALFGALSRPLRRLRQKKQNPGLVWLGTFLAILPLYLFFYTDRT